MSTPFALGPPPLPTGWTEHVGPGGQKYYYHAHTRESTYIRPLPSIPAIAVPLAKKEKPLIKFQIPGTEWVRVTTTEGNIFYSHKAKKESVWTVPDEIRDVVEALERRGVEKNESKQAVNTDTIGQATQSNAKRKAVDSLLLDEITVSKRVKSQATDQESDIESSEEEDWQHEAAIQLAIEAEEEEKKLEAEKHEELLRTQASIKVPEKVDLSVEEAKALFKALLREKDINPLHPWDTSLPKFVSDPRYTLLPSVTTRREAFDDYCRDRARELRQSTVKKEKKALDPKDEYELLLETEAKSTRTSWTDFRRMWKKDRRFYGWGRDDREREKKFRSHIKALGEKKRVAAQKVEADFFSLLQEQAVTTEGVVWKDVRQKLLGDPRYDAVGSSSLREELFNTFLKGQSPEAARDNKKSLHLPPTEHIAQNDKQIRKGRAVKEREDKINAQRNRLEADIERSRLNITKAEGEMEFKSLLTDAIRDPQVSWESAIHQLETDMRFRNSTLPLNQQLHLFHTHVGHLQARHISNLHALFESHALSLATPFDNLSLSSLISSAPVEKLGYGKRQVEHEYERWQRERTVQARHAFDSMLAENSFVEFWGRLGKLGGEGVDSKVQVDNDDIGENTVEGVAKVDMKALAKNIDMHEMEKVLKNDKRYIMFDHVPEERERWLRDYLAGLSAPKLSVHLSSDI